MTDNSQRNTSITHARWKTASFTPTKSTRQTLDGAPYKDGAPSPSTLRYLLPVHYQSFTLVSQGNTQAAGTRKTCY